MSSVRTLSRVLVVCDGLFSREVVPPVVPSPLGHFLAGGEKLGVSNTGEIFAVLCEPGSDSDYPPTSLLSPGHHGLWRHWPCQPGKNNTNILQSTFVFSTWSEENSNFKFYLGNK